MLHAINKLNLSKFEGIFIFQVTSPLRNLNTIKSFYKFCKKTIKNAITVSKTTALVSLNNENKKFKSLNDKEDVFPEDKIKWEWYLKIVLFTIYKQSFL